MAPTKKIETLKIRFLFFDSNKCHPNFLVHLAYFSLNLTFLHRKEPRVIHFKFRFLDFYSTFEKAVQKHMFVVAIDNMVLNLSSILILQELVHMQDLRNIRLK